jgi:hypothetical protein
MDQNISYVSDAVAHHSAWEELLLHHHMLGHMSFITLGQLYPDLHSRVDKGSLVCDACQYGKLTRSTYVSSDNGSSVPLQVIHSYVWGPSGVWSLNRYSSFVTFIDFCIRTTVGLCFEKQK